MSASQHHSSDSSDSVSPREPDPTLAETTSNIMRNLAAALEQASVSAARIAGPSFSRNIDLRPGIMLLARLNEFLPLLDKFPPPPHPDSRFMPPCPICHAKAGMHWAHECPQVPAHHWDIKIYDYRRKCMIFKRELFPPPNLESGDYGSTPMIPRCGICGKGPGAHWPDECPDNPIRDKMIGDRVVPPREQVAHRTDDW